jgi:hypothetical protein
VSVPTTATCATKCNSDCTGSCTATANEQCQETCQASSYEECEAQQSSTCTTQCESTGGAIFCDGSYVSTGNVGQCVSALNTMLTTQINATVSANSSTSCDGGECTTTATVNTKTSCSLASSPGGSGSGAFWPIGAAFAAVMVGLRRRSRRSVGLAR